MIMSRRHMVSSLLAMALVRPGLAAGSQTPFSHEAVVQLARDLSKRRYRAGPSVPQDWLDISYEQYRTFWARHDRALWYKSARPYEVDFFLPGLYFERPVRVNVVENGMARPVPFDLSRFDHTDKAPDLTVNDSLGYSGFRLRTELSQPGVKNEFCVFQGASYFRAIGHGQTYGLSARGLALKTADKRGEEFPDFTDFWIESPEPGQNEIVVHALLDSPSTTGAYQFVITPGPSCQMDVSAILFPRDGLDHVGIAPLTSMFLFDSKDRTRFDDFRPAVHDSNGLMIWNGAGEALWRPLNNPKQLQVSSFVDKAPRGFGLMQRARRFSDFNDLEAQYHQRPGLWVEPKSDWGKGSVTLVEIPADKEIYDNIVAYWRPARTYDRGEDVELNYRLSWCDAAPVHTSMPKVAKTAMGKRWNGGRMAAIDYEPHSLHQSDPSAYSIHVSSPHVPTTEGVLQRNPETGGLRLAFGFEPGERSMVELRAQLRKDGRPVSEVWLNRWTA